MALPTLTPEQRQASLAKAREARAARSACWPTSRKAASPSPTSSAERMT